MGIKENIKKLRETHNLSQKDMAKIAGVSDKAISSWETGEREPRMGAIQKMADHFGIKKSDIIEDAPNGTEPYYLNPETARIAQEIYDNPGKRALFDAVKDASPEDLKAVATMIKHFTNEE